MDADTALKKLIEGNKRFVNQNKTCPNVSSKRLKETSDGQNPFAVILSCSDSRVPEQLIFDCGVGDLFTVRVAGNVVGDFEMGSVEFGINGLGAKLIVVLGHTNCGAVEAAFKNQAVAGQMQNIINTIQPALRMMEAVRSPKEYTLDNAVDFNAVYSARKLMTSPIIQKMVGEDVYLLTAVYNVKTGVVEFTTSLSTALGTTVNRLK